MRAKVIVNSYSEKEMFAKFAYVPARCFSSIWMPSWRSGPGRPRPRPYSNGVTALETLEAALGDAAGTEVALERPSDAAHGDYATNVAMRLGGAPAATAGDR